MSSRIEGEIISECGDNGAKWARAFCEINPAMDEGTMIAWFANAIEAASDKRRAEWASTQERQADRANSYDRFDVVKRTSCMIASGPISQLKLAAYRVRDPVTGEYGGLQFHATYDNTVLALMGSEGARLFARFVNDTLGATQPAISVTETVRAGCIEHSETLTINEAAHGHEE